MTRLTIWLNAGGIAGAATILPIDGLADAVPETHLPVFLCLGSLLALLVGCGLAIHLGRYRYAAAAGLMLVVLIFLSTQPWYNRHCIPRDGNKPSGGYHYHCVWDMVHDH